MHQGFGGFPNPITLAAGYARSRIPGLERSLTMPRTTTIASTAGNRQDSRSVPYISFDATVGRNSRFKHLTKAQEEELGGVEYRVRELQHCCQLADR
jgi:hypothetical protein